MTPFIQVKLSKVAIVSYRLLEQLGIIQLVGRAEKPVVGGR